MVLRMSGPLGALCLSLMLAACGGGSSGGGSGNDGGGDGNSGDNGGGDGGGTTQQGVFIDAPVAGLQYTAGDSSGVTDAEGRFEYVVGQTVRFYIGGIELGQATGDDIVSPIDLVADAVDDSHPTVVNMVRFIQTIDDDGNPDNGIQITASVRGQAEGRSIDFSQSEAAFEADAAVTAALDELTAATNSGARGMVAREQALAHFRETLASFELEGRLEPGVIDGENLTLAQVESYMQSVGSGIWRTLMVMDAATSVTLLGNEITSQTAGTFVSETMFLSEGGQLLVRSCGEEVAEPVDEDEFAPSDDDNPFCQDEQIQYYRLDSGGLGVTLTCDGNILWAAEFDKISSQTTWHQGQLSMSSAQFPDLASTGEVCGMITDVEVTTSGFPDDFGDQFPGGGDLPYGNGTQTFWSTEVVAPYGNDDIELMFNFYGGSKQAGTYSVLDSVDPGTDGRYVVAYAESDAFGVGSNIVVTGGSVTISSVGLYTVSGSYNLSTATGDQLQGSFQLGIHP